MNFLLRDFFIGEPRLLVGPRPNFLHNVAPGHRTNKFRIKLTRFSRRTKCRSGGPRPSSLSNSSWAHVDAIELLLLLIINERATLASILFSVTDVSTASAAAAGGVADGDWHLCASTEATLTASCSWAGLRGAASSWQLLLLLLLLLELSGASVCQCDVSVPSDWACARR